MPKASSWFKDKDMNAHQQATGSAYFIDTKKEAVNTHTLAVIAENQPGVLARVIGLFAGRGYNIDSLTVSETEHEKHVSRFTIVTSGTANVIAQIKAQLERMVPVHSVADLTVQGNALARELAMVKVKGSGDKRVEALRLADAFRARVVDASADSFVFELTGKPEKVDQFIALMMPLGLIEVARTGVAAISRGPEAMKI
jgi:acetolactate synthase I/III small subunit